MEFIAQKMLRWANSAKGDEKGYDYTAFVTLRGSGTTDLVHGEVFAPNEHEAHKIASRRLKRNSSYTRPHVTSVEEFMNVEETKTYFRSVKRTWEEVAKGFKQDKDKYE